jgi:predicted dehydrogenase
VAFNYRYSPRNSMVKRLLADGAIGSVLSVHFEWLLDTRHGADYFRRWHRDKRNSGGLMVHKASHHWDLVNWWLDSRPEKVYGAGRLAFYGRENAEERGVTRFYERAHGSEAARHDPFAIDLADDPTLRGLYLDAEGEDGYLRDQSVFGNNISIEDDMAVLVSYASGATMSYHLTAYSPWEGYRVMFNGTKGRLELDVTEASYVSGSRDDVNQPGRSDPPPAEQGTRLLLRPLWEPPREVEVSEEGAGHGGGDVRMLATLFDRDRQDDPLRRASNHVDGALAILTGIAANRSFATGEPVAIADLVNL